jgi:hypothetical protein
MFDKDELQNLLAKLSSDSSTPEEDVKILQMMNEHVETLIKKLQDLKEQKNEV